MRLTGALIGACLLIGAAAPSLAQNIPTPVCDKPEKIWSAIERYDERLIGQGLSDQGVMVQLWASEQGGTWTIVVVGPERACVPAVGVGQNWREVSVELRHGAGL